MRLRPASMFVACSGVSGAPRRGAVTHTLVDYLVPEAQRPELLE